MTPNGSIVTGNLLNEAMSGAESTLAAMLGRMAAETGREVTWEELLKSTEVYDVALVAPEHLHAIGRHVAEQRIGRVHRLGQEHPVRVVNLVSRGTVEAYVLEILDRKIRMFELVVGEMEEILGAWQMQGSFEDEVFKIWVESKDGEARDRNYADFDPARHISRFASQCGEATGLR